MSKLLSEEQIEAAFIDWVKGIDNKYYCAVEGFFTFKAAFTLLMPIVEKQNEALSELVHHCRDYALSEESFVIAMAVDKANDTIQETKQMLEKLGEKK